MLPLVEEIRAARALVAESQRAAIDLAEVDGAVGALEVARRVRGASAPVDPGLRARLCAAWGLADEGTTEAFLASAQRHLRPRARSLMRRADEMIELQRRQREAMAAPEHRELAARVERAVHERDHLVHELTPLEQQVAVLEPSVATLGTFVARVREAEAEAASGEDPRGRAAWRAAAMAATLLGSLDALLREVSVPVTVPTLGPPGDASPERAADHRELAARGRAALQALRGVLADRLGFLNETLAPRRAERARLDAWLLEQLG